MRRSTVTIFLNKFWPSTRSTSLAEEAREVALAKQLCDAHLQIKLLRDRNKSLRVQRNALLDERMSREMLVGQLAGSIGTWLDTCPLMDEFFRQVSLKQDEVHKTCIQPDQPC